MIGASSRSGLQRRLVVVGHQHEPDSLPVPGVDRARLDPYSGTLNHPAPHEFAKARLSRRLTTWGDYVMQ